MARLYRVDETGWATFADSWPLRGEDVSLGEKVAEALSLPHDEAERLAREGLKLFRERHGERSDMTRRETLEAASMLTLGFGGIVLALLALVVGAIWLVVQLA